MDRHRERAFCYGNRHAVTADSIIPSRTILPALRLTSCSRAVKTLTDSLIESLHERLQECRSTLSDMSGKTPSASSMAKLRSRFGDDSAAVITEAASLQRKAIEKLGPGTWWATTRALQQTTPRQVSQLKASWCGDRLVYDLCCGIGGDTIAFAKRGPTIAVDKSPLMAAFNIANRREAGDEGKVDTRCADAESIDIDRRAVLHIDPDRRPSERRVTNPELYRPDFATIVTLVGRAEGAIVKLAPGADLGADLTAISQGHLQQAHRCWISLSGSVREQSLIFGGVCDRAELPCNARSAIVLDSQGNQIRFVAELQTSLSNAEPAEFLLDPDPAIRAAGLTAAFAERFGCASLSGPTGFLTADQTNVQEIGRLAKTGRIIWWGAADDRKIRRELRSRDAYPEVIKVRGSNHDPAILCKRYRKCGQSPITLWIGRHHKKVFAAFTSI